MRRDKSSQSPFKKAIFKKRKKEIKIKKKKDLKEKKVAIST